MRLWFANLIMYSVVLTQPIRVPFTDIGSAVMKMLADTRGIKISDDDKTELKGLPYPDVLGTHYPSCVLQAFGCSLSRIT